MRTRTIRHLVFDEDLLPLPEALVHHLVKAERLPDDDRLVEVFLGGEIFER